MTARKRDLPRTPAYVSRDVGAAELCISVGTWDNWVASGLLPPPVPALPGSVQRWRWADVEARLGGAPAPLETAPHAQHDGRLGQMADDQASIAAVVAAAEGFGRAAKARRRRG